jgi:serine/threonine-protein kinase
VPEGAAYDPGVYEVGQILADKYRVDYQLGIGGMGVVLAATHMHLGTQIALKVLHKEMARGAIVERFLREARASAQLRSENVCRVSDVGVLADGVPFIVMEMLVGQDLQTVLRTNGPMPVHVAADYILQACVGVAEAHVAGIIHRDLKPGNLMWTQRPDGTTLIKVLDFGVAKAPEGVDFSLTQTSNIIGSPGYMSPEQLKSSKDVDVRSDIWSLGIVLYELVSGKPPWNGESITELALRVAMDPMPPLVGVGPFETVIATCLEKDPAKRYQDLGEVAAALAPFAAGGAELAAATSRVLRGAKAVLPPAPQGGPPQSPTTLRGASGVISNRSAVTTKRTWKLPAVIGLGVGAAAIAVMVGVGGVGSRSATETTAPASATPTEAATTSGKGATPAAAAASGSGSGSASASKNESGSGPASGSAPASESGAATRPATPSPAAATTAAGASISESRPAAATKPKPVAKPKAKPAAKPKPAEDVGDIRK